MRQTEGIHLPRWILEARGQFVVRLTSWWTRDPKPVKSKHSELKIPVKHTHSFCFLLCILMILGENLACYLGLPLAQAERRLAEGDGGTVRSARRLGRDVVMGTPTEPTAVAVPVTNPTRESEVRERETERGGGKGRSVQKSSRQVGKVKL